MKKQMDATPDVFSCRCFLAMYLILIIDANVYRFLYRVFLKKINIIEEFKKIPRFDFLLERANQADV